jgi:hypothetical protein
MLSILHAVTGGQRSSWRPPPPGEDLLSPPASLPANNANPVESIPLPPGGPKPDATCGNTPSSSEFFFVLLFAVL